MLQFERKQTLSNTQVLISSLNKRKLNSFAISFGNLCDRITPFWILCECLESVCITAPEIDKKLLLLGRKVGLYCRRGVDLLYMNDGKDDNDDNNDKDDISGLE